MLQRVLGGVVLFDILCRLRACARVFRGLIPRLPWGILRGVLRIRRMEAGRMIGRLGCRGCIVLQC